MLREGWKRAAGVSQWPHAAAPTQQASTGSHEIRYGLSQARRANGGWPPIMGAVVPAEACVQIWPWA
ncbi:hypothetical protein MHY13_06345 [Corynebacterium sp. ACRPE]|uniref:hypothetical protein n=1 Tax=Corynebacterium TaxID=1716 RepID=UPI00195A697B|nr:MULTISPECIES: hypothetical protein [Corynebacterium]MCG7467747.1 hypothetical protein [Corynebacterium sp. ACRPE]QRQ68340.1 hypothetical protein I6J28_10200 [Corynebacterium tuberculostearicum]